MFKLIFISLGMFALGLDAYVIAGIIPQISSEFQITDAQTGQAITIFTFCYAVSAPLLSTIFAKISVKKILVFALTIFTFANIISALSSTLTILLLSRALAGIGAGLFSPIAANGAVSLVGSHEKGKAIGFVLGGMSCGTVIGVPLGVLISEYYSWHCTFWLVVLFGIIGIVGIAKLFPELQSSPLPSLKERLSVLVDKKITSTIFITILTAISSLGMYTYISPFLVNSITTGSILSYLWVWGIGGVIGSFSVGFLIDKFRNSSVILIFILLVMSVSITALNFIGNLGGFIYIFILLWGSAGWASLAPQQHVLLEYQPKHGAAVLGLNSSCNYLGGAIGSLLGGVILVYGVNPNSIPLYAGTVGGIALILQILITYKKKNLYF